MFMWTKAANNHSILMECRMTRYAVVKDCVSSKELFKDDEISYIYVPYNRKWKKKVN